MWITIVLIIFVAMIALVVALFIKDRKYEKRSVTEALSRDMWDDIAKEREEGLEKARKFKEALSKAAKKN